LTQFHVSLEISLQLEFTAPQASYLIIALLPFHISKSLL